jgi:hypothetical protein
MTQTSHKTAIENLLKFKKHGNENQMATLEDKGKLRVWLNKHINRKGITWFEKNSGNYRLKIEHIRPLKGLIRQDDATTACSE